MHDDASDADQRELIRHGLRVMGGFVRAHPVPFVISLIGSVVMAVGTVATTVVLGWVTDDLILPEFSGTDAGRSTTYVVAAMLGVAVVRSLGVIVRRYCAGMTVFRSKNDLQLALADQYLAMPPEHVRVAAKGRLLAHADSDVDVATDMLSPMPFTLGVVTLLGVSVVSLALVDWTMMVVAVAMMPAVVGLNRLNARATEGPAVAVRESVGRTSAVASESFDGALVVKTLGREAQELERFATAASELRDHSVRLGRVRALFGAALDLVPDLGVVVLVVLGAWRVGNGHITTGELVQVVALFTLLVFPLRVIGYFFGDIPPSVVAHDRVAAMLAGPIAERGGHAELPPGPLALEVDSLCVSYGGTPALEEVDLRIAPGEVVAVVGRTGCGKSTLITAITAMVPVERGEVRIAGRPVGTVSALSLATRTATVWQEPFLLGASVRENIEFGVDLSHAEIVRATDAAQFSEVIRTLPDGLETLVGERGVRLSGGQRQRLALARAIARRPGLLLLDDATSAVDPVVEERILDAVRGLGCTIVVVAHRRSTVALADRVVFMRDGRVAAVGGHTDLLAEPDYVALLAAYDRESGAVA